jgi:hypothetical protein
MKNKKPIHRWNKIKQRLAGITAPELNISFNNSPVRKKTAYSEIIIRFFQVKLNGEVIWWFPKDSEQPNWGFLYGYLGENEGGQSKWFEYPQNSIIKYLDLPKEQLLQYEDKAGLADILKICDKRIGYHRLKDLELSEAAKKIFDVRFKEKQKKVSTDNI